MNKKIPALFLIFFVFLAATQEVFSSSYLAPQDSHSASSELTTQRLHYGNDPMQFGDLRLPSGKGLFPVVIIIHGGCWLAKYGNVSAMNPLAITLTQEGIATWNIEYRAIDQPGGGWPGTFQDIGHAVNYLQKIAPRYHLNLNDVVIVGHSAGGHLALWAAARSKLPHDSPLYTKEAFPIRGVVDLAGPGSLASFYLLQDRVCGQAVITQLLGGSPSEEPERYQVASPIALLPLGVKQILITGDNDSTVPPILGKEYAAAAKKAGDDVQFILVKNASHGDIVFPNTNAWPITKKAIFDLLKIKMS